MVQANIDSSTGVGTIVLRPNNSESWRVNKLVVASLACISGMIALWFLWQGLWMVLPFSGLELLWLYLALCLCMRNNIRTEVIVFEDDKVTIERGKRFIEEKSEYPRAWSTILVRQPPFRGHLKQIFIRSHGKEQELGAFLSKSDRETLIQALRRAIYH